MSGITWNPTDDDVQWTRDTLAMLKDKATWAVPISMSIIEINKPEKTFHFRTGSSTNETNARIVKVLTEHLGYKEV